MNPLMPLVSILPLVVFYLWMFRDMTLSDTLSPGERYAWTWAFLLLNIFAAVWYFMQTRYRR
jgi:hypothetical protein